jgi:hypothetical protein
LHVNFSRFPSQRGVRVRNLAGPCRTWKTAPGLNGVKNSTIRFAKLPEIWQGKAAA